MDYLSQGVAYLGVPYRLHSSDPTVGWDCWGLVSTLRERIFGRPTPSWAEVYTPADACSAEKVAQLFRDRMDGWGLVERRAGAVLLLTIFQRPAHVGLLLDDSNFIHVMQGHETAIEHITAWDKPGRSRLKGVYDTV